jgi:hypothetical protein
MQLNVMSDTPFKSDNAPTTFAVFIDLSLTIMKSDP